MTDNEDKNIGKDVASVVTTIATGVPEPIRKNIFKAFGQLCSSLIDIPVAKLEGKAKEIRAQTDARISLIQAQSKIISDKIEVPEDYINKAAVKFGAKIVQEQINLDNIGQIAFDDLKENSPAENEEIKDLSEDWLNSFENIAKLKSSDEVQLVFGKILSGEIKRPGSYSIRTLKILDQLDNQAAKLFQTLCSMTIALKAGNVIIDARVVSMKGNPATNTLSEYGLNYDSLNRLQEYGLIISDYNSNMKYSYSISNNENVVQIPFINDNQMYGFVPTDKENYDRELKLNGVALSTAGKELLEIIPVVETEKYWDDFREYIKKKKLAIVKLK